MKVIPGAAPVLEKEATPGSSPVRVCMHILSSLRNDVRGMRAATALVEAGYSVTIIDVESESAAAHGVEGEQNSPRVQHLIVPDSFIATRFKRHVLIRALRMFVRSTLELLRTPADVYHALDLPALPACYIAARLRRKQVVFESYELPLATLPASQLSRGRRWLHAGLNPLLRHILPRCAGVIAVSSPIVLELKQQYALADVTLIRNIPEYRVVPRGDRLRQYLGLDAGMRIALYQGFLQPDRGLDRLVRAARYLDNNVVIVMMGSSAGTTRTDLEALIASEGVADRVKIIPSVPYSELLDWTASADLGLIVYDPQYAPNVGMMLPNKLFEYLMAGLPVLASWLEPTVEVIRAYDVGGVVSSLAPADIAQAINNLLSDGVALARMRQNALRAAREDLCWEREKQHIVGLYRRIQAPGL